MRNIVLSRSGKEIPDSGSRWPGRRLRIAKQVEHSVVKTFPELGEIDRLVAEMFRTSPIMLETHHRPASSYSVSCSQKCMVFGSFDIALDKPDVVAFTNDLIDRPNLNLERLN